MRQMGAPCLDIEDLDVPRLLLGTTARTLKVSDQLEAFHVLRKGNSCW